MTREERISIAIAKLKNEVAKAQLPEDLSNHRACFTQLLNLMHEKYNATRLPFEKNIVYLSIAELASFHAVTMLVKHPEYNTFRTATVSRFFTPDPAAAYFLKVKKFAAENSTQELIQEVLNEASTMFVQPEGYKESLEYHLGTRLANENGNNASNLDQFINRMMACIYIHHREQESQKVITHSNLGYAALNLSAVFIMPPLLPAALVTTIFTYSRVTGEAEMTQRSLSRVKFIHELNCWKTDFLNKLISPESLKELIPNAQQNVKQALSTS